ncbi:hypothetical protein CBH39_005110 [Salmonella enterica subsp. enterica serovar 4,[5],12:b:-]|nr:hypothetical protein [Salmonella enterica subsp. enterica serovar 4,[5],12:b:-]EDQ8094686.1 hypothetical protein [Salmonella enterica subsp. enterica serovar Java]EDV2543235.1 hypothetical protein [Salmonella enterica subsp. enterica serovar Oranienburg]EDX0152077.1 hypothetical protein [Salmonella enterica]EEE5613119.1 hypothetical protein [Salmonella enterica subsp. enterica serovar Typhimurium]
MTIPTWCRGARIEGLNFARREATALLKDGGMAHPQAKARLLRWTTPSLLT